MIAPRAAVLLLALPLAAAAQDSLLLDASPLRATDPLGDRADLSGRVCEDLDGDGRCGTEDGPIAGAVVELENGFYAVSDETGRWRLSDVRPGQTLLKLSAGSLPPGAELPASSRRVVELPRAGLVVADFAVKVKRETVKIGRAEKIGTKLFPAVAELPVSVAGNVNDLKVLGNGVQVKLPIADADLSGLASGGFVKYQGGAARLSFLLKAAHSAAPVKWQLSVADGAGTALRQLSGDGQLPRQLPWDGRDDKGKSLAEMAAYSYRVCAQFADGERACSPFRAFGVLGERGQRPKVDRPVQKARAVLNGEEAPIDADGSFRKNVPPDDKRLVKLDLAKPDGRSATGTFRVPTLEVSQPAGPIGVEWGQATREVIATKGTDRVELVVAGSTGPENKVTVSDRNVAVDKGGRFTRVLTVPRGKSKVEIVVSGPGGWNTAYQLEMLLGEKDPGGKPIVAVERIPDLEVEVPAELTAGRTFAVRGKAAPGSKVTVGGEAVELGSDGSFRHRVTVGEAGDLVVAVDDGAGHRGEVKRAVGVSEGGTSVAALGDASPGGQLSSGKMGGALAGGAEGSVHYRSGTLALRFATGAIPGAPRALEIPLHAGMELGFGHSSLGLHLLGGWFQDFAASGSTAALLAQKGYVAAPTVAFTTLAGPARLFADAGWRALTTDAVSAPDPATSAALKMRAQYWAAGAGARIPAGDAFEVSLRAGVANALGAPAAAKPSFPERIEGWLNAQLRLGDTGRSTVFARYAFLSDRHSFDPTPPGGARQDHVATVGASLDLLDRPGLLRLTPAVALDLTREGPNPTLPTAISVPLYYALLRADVQATDDLLVGADYRLQLLPGSGAAKGATVHWVSVEASYALFGFSRLGVLATLKQPGTPDDANPAEQQILGRIQVFY